MSSTIDLLICGLCGQEIAEGYQYTQCRSCQRYNHLMCAGVLKVDQNYGCRNCFVEPGNNARNKLRNVQGRDFVAGSLAGESPNTSSNRTVASEQDRRPSKISLDAQSNSVRYLVSSCAGESSHTSGNVTVVGVQNTGLDKVTLTSASNLRSNSVPEEDFVAGSLVGEDSNATGNRTEKENKRATRGKSPSMHSSVSGRSVKSELMMDLMNQNAQLLKQVQELVQQQGGRSSHSGSSRAQRTKDWVAGVSVQSEFNNQQRQLEAVHAEVHELRQLVKNGIDSKEQRADNDKHRPHNLLLAQQKSTTRGTHVAGVAHNQVAQRVTGHNTTALNLDHDIDRYRFSLPDEETMRRTRATAATNAIRVTNTEEFMKILADVKKIVESRPPRYSRSPPDLPHFQGSEKEWPRFIANYIESTMEYFVSDLNNISRLEKALGKVPLQILQQTVLFSSSLGSALDSLRQRYGDPLAITMELEREVLELPKIDQNGKGLQAFALKLQGLVNAIEACGLNDNLSSQSLVSRLQHKLPQFMGMRWGEYTLTKTPTLPNFSAYIQRELLVSLKAGQTQVRIDQPGTSQKRWLNHHTEVLHEEEPQENVPQGERFPVNAQFPQQQLSQQQLPQQQQQPQQQPPANNQSACVHCKGAHRLATCPDFAKLDSAVRFKVVTDNRLCWKCLRPHSNNSCRQKVKCNVDDCKFNHDPLLHEALQLKFNHHVSSTMVGGPAMFKVVPITLGHGDKTVNTYAFVDTGSSVSMIDSSLAAELGAKGEPESLTIKWSNNQYRTDPNSFKLRLDVYGVDGKRFAMRDVYSVSDLDLPEQSLDRSTIDHIFPDGGGPLPFTHAVPKILIGLLDAHLSVPFEIREDTETNLIAINTRLGWLIYGGGTSLSPHVSGLNFRVCHQVKISGKLEADEELHKILVSFYDTESFGVRPAPKKLSQDDERAFKILEATTRHTGAKYESGLLWAVDAVELPPTRDMCVSRAKGLKRRLDADPDLGHRLQALIDRYVSKGYCREVSSTPPHSPTWYLPVFPVIKPGKDRLVWDAAAKVDGRSLNSYLLTGPDLLNKLPEVIVRLREREVGCSGDVTEMFHQVGIREEDRDAQRFIWFPVGSDEMKEYRMEVMTFGASCSPSTAQYVQIENAKNYADQYPDAVYEILNNMYVDDLVTSFKDVETARRVIKEIIEIQKRAGFVLRKWRCSDPNVLVDTQEVGKDEKAFGAECGKVLGLWWNCKDDSLQYATRNIIAMRNVNPLTRRRITSGTHQLFDPIGGAATVVVQGKMLTRSCLDVGWDDEVSEDVKQRWFEWCDNLLKLDKISFPRFHGIAHGNECELHIFVDASESAFIATAYLRGRASDGKMVCSLVMAKSKAAPRRPMSIPRMELQSAVLGSRLAGAVMEATTLPVARKVFWTDSTDVLCWIRSSHRRYHAFVGARINEILSDTRENEWRWVPTEQNVADDATRPSSPVDSRRWLRGPDFLYQDEAEWPVERERQLEPKEMLKPVLIITLVDMGLIPDPVRFSKWLRLVRATAYALRVMNIGKHLDHHASLQPDELIRAEEELFRGAQLEAYSDVIKKLKENSAYSPSKHHTLHKLCPLLDSKSILRVDGRLPASFDTNVRQPIIIPSTSRITVLFVQHKHGEFLHGSHEAVVNEIRRVFHVPGLRKLVRRVARACLECQIRHPKPKPPQMGLIPLCRVSIGWRCFTYCGLDYFGPFEVVVGRRREKRWVPLFTCMTTRAVHIGVVHSLDTSSCIMAVRTLMATRDVQPIEMRSDNATCFRATDKEISALQDRFPAMKWIFNPPGAPHMGGAWERMVGVVKRAFKTVVGDQPLSDEVLRCALAEAEWVVNAHPLTDVPMQPEDEEALTPNHFLHGGSRRRLHEGVSCGEEVAARTPSRKSWRSSQQIADHFWKRFSREVVPVLNQRTKWWVKSEPLQIGDVVMVADEMRRGAWKRGVVTEAIGCKDSNQVRQVRVKTATGVIMRPAVKVAKVDALLKDP